MKLLSVQKMKEIGGKKKRKIQPDAFIQYHEPKAIIYHVHLGFDKGIFIEYSDLTIKRTLCVNTLQ